MKKTIGIFLSCCLLAGVLGLYGCSQKNQEISIDPIVLQYMTEARNVQNSKIVGMDIEAVEGYTRGRALLSVKDIEESVTLKMELRYRWEKTDKTSVSMMDAIRVDYSVSDGSEVVFSEEGITVAVGEGRFLGIEESQLVGLSAGESVTVTVPSVPNPVLSRYPGGKITVTVREIGAYQEIGEGVPEWLTRNGFASFRDYYRQMYDQAVTELEFEFLSAERDRFYRHLIDCCEYEIDPDDLVNVSLEIVADYEALADSLGMSVSEFGETMLEGDGGFFHQCTEDGEYEIKKILAVGALVQHYSMETDPELYQEYAAAIGPTAEAYAPYIEYECLAEQLAMKFILP